MEIIEVGIAGTLESSDAMVRVGKSQNAGITITLDSTVEKQYGNQIRKVILETAQSLGITNACISVVDKGALDCTIQARVMAAIYRACKTTEYIWDGGSRA